MSDELVFVNYEIRSISPTRLIPTKDLGIDAADLPEELQQLLRQDCFDRRRLRPFEKIRKRFESRLMHDAARGRLGWGIPKSSAQPVVDYARTCQEEYQAEREQLLHDLPGIRGSVIDNLEASYSGYSWCESLKQAILHHIPTADYIQRNILFRYALTRVEGVVEDGISDDLAAMKRGYADDLIDEIVKSSKEFLDVVTDGETAKRGVHPQTLKRIQRMAGKVKRLSFIDTRLKGLHEGLERLDRNVVRPAAAKEKRVPLNELGELTAALHMLSDRKHLNERLDKGETLMWASSGSRQVHLPQVPSQPAPTPVPSAAIRQRPVKKSGRSLRLPV